eukprot:866605-Alexandrium_andersonii.AAC.2
MAHQWLVSVGETVAGWLLADSENLKVSKYATAMGRGPWAMGVSQTHAVQNGVGVGVYSGQARQWPGRPNLKKA